MSNDPIKDIWGRIERREATLRAEAQRIAEAKALGHVPPECGDAIPHAPARGPVRTFEPIARYPDGTDGYVLKPSGYRGRKALHIADQFDQARVSAQRAARSKHQNAIIDLPFTKQQENIGRLYRDLSINLSSRGFSLSSLAGVRSSSSGQRDFMERYADDLRHLQRLHARIGRGCALPVRRLRPSERGTKRGIMDRDLIDLFCIHDKPVSQILKVHGWKANGRTRATLIAALRIILDRMDTSRGSASLQRMGAPLTMDGLKKGIDR